MTIIARIGSTTGYYTDLATVRSRTAPFAMSPTASRTTHEPLIPRKPSSHA